LVIGYKTLVIFRMTNYYFILNYSEIYDILSISYVLLSADINSMGLRYLWGLDKSTQHYNLAE